MDQDCAFSEQTILAFIPALYICKIITGLSRASRMRPQKRTLSAVFQFCAVYSRARFQTLTSLLTFSAAFITISLLKNIRKVERVRAALCKLSKKIYFPQSRGRKMRGSYIRAIETANKQ